MVNFMEYTLDCIRKGKISLDPNIVTARVTYHDPCNIARSGWRSWWLLWLPLPPATWRCIRSRTRHRGR